MMTRISRIRAWEALDSRGNPTIAAQVTLECGAMGRALVPSGASTGRHEALELRDGDTTRYFGKGVRRAVSNINELLGPVLIQKNAAEQETIDRLMIELDGTENKSRLGANAILAVSLACAKASAVALSLPLYRHIGGPTAHELPVPMMNIVNGGAHANNNLDVQEFMIVPAGAKSFSESLRIGVEVYHTLRKILKRKGYSTGVGDEGGFAPSLATNEEALELMCQAIEEAGYEPGKHVWIAIDLAATELYKSGTYSLRSTAGFTRKSSTDLVELLEQWVERYPLISIEDGVAEDDWDGWKLLTARLGTRVQLVGDDIFVTNPQRFTLGVKRRVANAIMIKLNQIGTLTETLGVVELAKKAAYKCVVGNRSGETEDTSLAILSVACNAGQVKTGAPCRSDRTAKYNELLWIEDELGTEAVFRGSEVYFARCS